LTDGSIRVSRIRVPAEWSEQRRLFTAWPSHVELWQEDLQQARSEVAAMVRALAAGQAVTVIACGAEALTTANESLGGVARIVSAPFGDIWVRDTGPIFAGVDGQLTAIRFRNNGWGGKYALPNDDAIGDEIAALADTPAIQHEFILEGGALEHNGEGWVLTTRQCLLNPNRNPGWTQELAERHLQESLGCKRVLWLQEGLLNDHTDGHVDNLARFIGADTVVCQHASGADDPNADLYKRIAIELASQGLQVCTIPSPGRVLSEDGEVMPASHMNFIIGNHAVVVPVYGTASSEEAVSLLQQLFPDRQVLGVRSNALLTGGGSFHCITQQEPAL
jgi:agmatine deiminase